MTLTEELDMVGVELQATWTATRKTNGDALQNRIVKKTNFWKGGKFMPLSMRGGSINTYCLSTVWFKSHSVDLRVMDISKISKAVKSWLYADMLFKPEEMIMERPIKYGGLGILNVKYKAMAGLIRTFLETACNPKFRHSLYHELLFRYHVQDDRSINDPGIPPFYSETFFESIKKVYTVSPLSIGNMTEAQWYQLLLEENVTKEDDGEQGKSFRKCRVELMNLENDWETTWRRMRLHGLGSELTSFLFKVIHQLLTTQDRLFRINQAKDNSAYCKAAGCSGDQIEDLKHSLILCPGNDEIGIKCLDVVKTLIPDITADGALLLKFEADTSLELPVVWFLSMVWKMIWEARSNGKKPTMHKIRSEMEARVALLRTTRLYVNDIMFMEILITSME